MASYLYLGTSIISNGKPSIDLNKIYKKKDDVLKINLSEEDKDEFLIANNMDIQTKEKIIKEILGEKLIENGKQNKIWKTKHKISTKSKVGYLKEGYNNIYGINPIDRYNFVIDRYNEDINRDKDIYLMRVPSIKVIRKIYDFYTWIARIIFGIFLIIAYYCYSFKYNENKKKIINESNELTTRTNRRRVITYRNYLFNEKQDFFKRNAENPKCYIILLGLLFLLFSFYMALVFFLVMFIPNIIFTLYLSFSLVIHRKNKMIVSELFKNMIYESKLDEKSQLNDYIIVDSRTLKFYSGFTFYEKLYNLYNPDINSHPRSFMLYGDLFANEYNILVNAFYKQIIGIFGFAGVGFMFYF